LPEGQNRALRPRRKVWELKLTPEWVGTDAKKDIPLPRNVRRYYIPSNHSRRRWRRLQHEFASNPPGQPASYPPLAQNCPGNNYGNRVFSRLIRSRHTQTVNALRVHSATG